MNGEGLLALQLLDSDLDQLAAQERRLPERAALAEAEAAKRSWQVERDAQAKVAEDAAATIARSEHESAALDTKRRRLEQQLKTIIAPREAEALMHEIATLQGQRNTLDDVELEAMEVQSGAEGAIAQLDERGPALVAAIAAARAALDSELARVAGERATLVERRDEARAAIDDAGRRAYDGLRERFGGVGVVRLHGRTCTGCHLDLSAGEADVVKSAPADVLPECPHCGRLIVR